jgi:hypothetical protein
VKKRIGRVVKKSEDRVTAPARLPKEKKDRKSNKRAGRVTFAAIPDRIASEEERTGRVTAPAHLPAVHFVLEAIKKKRKEKKERTGAVTAPARLPAVHSVLNSARCGDGV